MLQLIVFVASVLNTDASSDCPNTEPIGYIFCTFRKWKSMGVNPNYT